MGAVPTLSKRWRCVPYDPSGANTAVVACGAVWRRLDGGVVTLPSRASHGPVRASAVRYHLAGPTSAERYTGGGFPRESRMSQTSAWGRVSNAALTR